MRYACRYVALLLCLAGLAACSPGAAPGPIPLPSAPASGAAATPALPASDTPIAETGTPAPGPATPTAALPGPAAEATAQPAATVAPAVSPPAAEARSPLPANGAQTAQPSPVPTFESDALRPDPRLRRPAFTPTPAHAPAPDGEARTLHVPILMYHYVSAAPAVADAVRRDNSVSPALFESHLQYLRDHGYHVVTLDDLYYALTQGRPLPDKPVVLTFDDGYEDAYTNAFPLLRKYGMTGQFFLITDFVNQGRPEYMTWPQIEEMARAGQIFGSHSRDHPDLSGKPLDYLVWETLGPTEAIQEHLGSPPKWVAYPSGSYDARTIAVFKSANYWGGLTTHQGATHSSSGVFELSRVRVRGSYSAEDLGRLLDLDW